MIEIRIYTDIELLALPPVVVDPGTIDANGITRNREESNPFKPAVESRATANLFDSARRWAAIHIPNAYAKPADETPEDSFDAIFGALAGQRLWHEARNEAGELMAVHPITAKDVDAWERDSIAMHDRQQTIVPSPKIEESAIAHRKTLVRGS